MLHATPVDNSIISPIVPQSPNSMTHRDFAKRIQQLNTIGVALSTEQDREKLLALILEGAQALTHADGGTIYLVEDECLNFKVLRNNSLNLAHAADHESCLPFAPIPLIDEHGQPNLHTAVAYAASTGETLNLADIRQTTRFDISGTLAYDTRNKYESRAFLCVPMRNHEQDIIGVLQLINPVLPGSNTLTAFTHEDQQLVESLASQAAITLTNQALINNLQQLLEQFIEVIADAIDEKSPYTGGHCRRVPDIAQRLAQAVNQHTNGPLADVRFDEVDLYELNIAALLHDCGKITTPVHVVDKATKLETIFDRIELIKARLEVIRRDLRIAELEGDIAPADAERERLHLDQTLAFLSKTNLGSEFMDEGDRQQILDLARRYSLTINGESQALMTEEEIQNLTISKGTLTDDERAIINRHISTTQHMLSKLSFPKHLQQVPEIAGSHHERMDGKGYPNQISGDEMSLRARIMAIADVFEALTASDRPYKKAMAMSQAIAILDKMAATGHIDPELFQVFMEQEVYRHYALANLPDEQLDI